MEVKEIEITQLNLETPLNYSFFLKEYYKSLENSIREFGIFYPIFAIRKGKNVIPFSGFKRIFFAEGKVPVIFFKGIDLLKAFRISISENISHRQLNFVEISNIVKSLIVSGYDEKIIYENIFSLLELNPKKTDIDFFLNLSGLSNESKGYIFSGDFSVKSLKRLFKFPERFRDKIFLTSKALRLTRNQENFFIFGLYELWRKGGDIENIFHAIDKVKEDKMDLPQVSKKIMELLEEMNYPIQVKYRKKFSGELKKMGVKPFIKVLYPDSFEERKLKIEVEVKPETLKDVVVFFKNLEDNKFLYRMSEIIL